MIFLGFLTYSSFFTWEKSVFVSLLRLLQICEIVLLGAVFKFGSKDKVSTLHKLCIK